MNEQLDLFASPAPRGRELVRREDPSTSKAAAARVDEFRSDHHARILSALEAIERRTCAGATYEDIADASGIDPVAVARRLNELSRSGAIACVGSQRTSSGRQARAWALNRSKSAAVAG